MYLFDFLSIALILSFDMFTKRSGDVYNKRKERKKIK